MPTNRLPRIDLNFDREIAEPGHVQCIVGETIRRVRVWSEKEWARFDPAEKPSPAEYFPGLGWIGIEPARKAD